MYIYDFNGNKKSGRRYGGNAGLKIGLILDENYWFLKFPQNIKNLNKVQISYSTSPLSEYIGSHIYKLIGIPVHETLLGEYDGKIVVACKDFCEKKGDRLDSFEIIKNDYVKGIDEDVSNLSTASDHTINLKAIKSIMSSNELFTSYPDLKERFWDMFIIDALIGNNDRNNGNWGVIVNEDNNTTILAPVYDNGNSFSNKSSESQLERLLSDEKLFIESAYTSRISYFRSEDGKKINPLKYIETIKDEDCNKAILRIIPNIDIDKIKEMINDIPYTYKNYNIIGHYQKEFYIKCLEYRYEKVLLPTYIKLTSPQPSDDGLTKEEEQTKGRQP